MVLINYNCTYNCTYNYMSTPHKPASETKQFPDDSEVEGMGLERQPPAPNRSKTRKL